MYDPDMGNWHYYYDLVGNLIEQTDAKGQSITFEYDAINRLISKSTGVTYTYDDGSKPNCIGRLSRVNDSSGSTEFFYDILGREVKTIKNVTSASYTIERTYDSLDRLITVTYPDSTIVKYAYNTQGGIKSVTDGAGTTSYVSSVDYNANGQIERISYGNGTSTTYNYDPYNFRLDKLQTLSGSAHIQDLSYNFDPVGNVTSILDSSPNGTNTQYFQYDDLNRLVYANGASYGVINYQYNSIGNILQKGGLTMAYGERGAGPHAVTSVTGAKNYLINYDLNGNMTSKGNTTFEYDIENRLKKVTSPKGGGSFDITVDLHSGWNFISIPGFIPNTNNKIADILSSISDKYEQVSKYDPVTDKWKHFVNNTKFNQFDTFDPGEGYLIYVKEACALRLEGLFPLSSATHQLSAGWNLINAPTKTSIPVAETLQGINYDSVKVYNGTGYDEATTLEAGKAYFVHVNSNQTWTVPLPKEETKYSYDGDGGRVLRQQKEELTVYIGSSYELEGLAGQSATKVTKHIFMGSTRICSIETTTNTHVYYYHQDHIGSSNVITDESGNIVQILEYSPYGEVSRSTGDYSTDKRFTGKIWDETSALSYFGARYYDPEIGRFITPDSTIAHPFDPQDLNRYGYCRNNPVNYTDPTGESWWSAFWNFVAGFFGAVAAVVVTALTGSLQFGLAVGGAVSGAILGGVSGGWEGALKGAAIGFVIGATMGAGIETFGPGFAIAAMAGGAAYSGATGGAEGLGDFAAGVVGGIAGSAVGSAIVSNNSATGAASTSAGADAPTPAEIQQSNRAAADIQGMIDAASQERGTSLGRIIVTPQDITPVDYGPRMGMLVGKIGLKAASDIKMKVPYNGRITFSPYGKGIVARTANGLGVAAKWFGRALGVASLGKHINVLRSNWQAGGGFLQGAHDLAMVGADAVSLFGKGTPLRFVSNGADAVDMASEYWANRIYGVH